MNVYPNIAYIAGLIGDPTRAAILGGLMDGRALPASELAYMARVSPQTVSSHLAKLVEGNLLSVDNQGRHRYYRLASSEVAQALEILGTIAPPVKVRSLRQSDRLEKVRIARTCYDHLAGKLGVSVTEGLISRGLICLMNGEYIVTEGGKDWFQRLGIDYQSPRKSRRIFARPCLDWSERRHHIAGKLGSEIALRFFELGWIRKLPDTRAVQITEIGQRKLEEELGVHL
jgi:DNA-binding transcriptional ArsR family regulator